MRLFFFSYSRPPRPLSQINMTDCGLERYILYFNGKASANADVHLTESRYQALFYVAISMRVRAF